MKLQNPFLFDFSAHAKEPGGGKSETVPDESMSPRELYERFTVGGGLPPGRQPIFADGDLDSDDLEKLRDADVFVREQRARSVAADIQQYEAQLRAEAVRLKAQRAKASDDAADAAYAAAQRRAADRAKPKGEAQQEGGLQ